MKMPWFEKLLQEDFKSVVINYLIFLVCNRGDTIQYHSGLRSRELGQAPMLQVFLTPRQALSSHPLKQMVWLYWLQDRSHSTKGHRRAAVGFIVCVCSVVGWLIVYQLGSSIGAWPNSLDRRPLWYCIVSPLLYKQTNISVNPQSLFRGHWGH